jgi:Mg-chelatase subunit ChlD
MRSFALLRPFAALAFLSLALLAHAAPQALVAGAELKLDLSPASPKAEFTVANDASRLFALRVVAADAGANVRFRAKATAQFGTYTLSSDFPWIFTSVRATSQLWDSFPQFPATWTIEAVLSGKEPAALSIRFEEQGAAPDIRWGEAPGTLLVRNVGQSRVSASPEKNLLFRHPLYKSGSVSPDITPAGDALFRLPAGIWQLSAGGGEGVRELRSALIPISSGGETVVDWPQMRTLEGEKTKGLTELVLREVTADDSTGTMLVAAPMFAEAPKPEAVRIIEGGQPGEVLSIEPIPAKLHVVVLFDSSFSMRKIFGEAQNAALGFIEKLPPECTVDFFDFDTKVKELAVPDRAALLEAVRNVKADGSTKLYDSVMRGLGKTAAHRRSAVVVFTDGFDAQVEDPGYGSRASQEEVFDAVTAAKVPLFTIAYGEKPDEQTLQKLADISGGAYYRAQADTIGTVFEQIRGLVDRDYKITYRRPAKVSASNTPVLTLVLDVSGSMDKAPSATCGYRIEKAKDLLRGFFGRVPAGSVVQLFTFSDAVDLVQVPTNDPARLRRALVPVVAGGGTETLLATKAALGSLEKIPSRNRYLLFITDAALNVPDAKQHKEFEQTLAALKEQNIRSLWVGMVDAKEKAPFENAAVLSGGNFVVSPGTDSLAQALAALEKSLTDPSAANEVAVELLIDKPDAAGAHRLFGGTGLFPLPVSASTAEHSVGCLTATITNTADEPKLAINLPGAAPSSPTTDNRPPSTGSADSLELNRIPIEKSAKNEAAEFTVHEARLYSKLHGFDLPASHRFVELHVTIKNVLPEQQIVIPDKGAAHPAAWVTSGKLRGKTVVARPPYLIPDLRHHVFLRWNDSAELPPSALSVLDPAPLFLPDDPSLLVQPGAAIDGRLVFLVQGTNLQQASLHFYDTAYRHFDLALVGPLAVRPAALATLPTSATAQLSDTFALQFLGSADSPDAVAGVAPGKGNVFRTLQLNLESRVQALLNVQPAASFDLLLGTDKGPLSTPLAPLTDLIPGGLYRPASLAPGSHNRFQQLYCLPAALGSAPAALFVETKTKDVVLPFAAPLPPYITAAPVDPETGIAIAVNSLSLAGKEAGLDKPMLVADVTIADAEDKFSTSLSSHFVLVRVAGPGAPFVDPDAPTQARTLGAQNNAATKKGLGTFATDESQKDKPRRVDAATAGLLFGFPADTVIPDGATRRGTLLFNPPAEGEWVLAFHGRELARMTAPVATPLPATDAFLVARRPNYPTLDDRNLTVRIEKLVAAQVRAGAFKHLTRDAKSATPLTDETGSIQPVSLEPPALTAAGAAAWKTLLAADEATLWKTIGSLRLQSSADKPWTVHLSPEAVLTQHSGTVSDLAELARQWYAERNLVVTTQQAALSEAGKQRLREKLPYGDLPAQIPVLTTPQGTWAVPFAVGGTEAVALLATAVPGAIKPAPSSTQITLTIVCTPLASNAAAKMADMGSALGGGSAGGDKRFVLWNGSIPTAALSRDAVDLFLYETGGKDPELRAQFEGPDGLVDGKPGLKTLEWKPVRELIEIRTPGQKVRILERELGEAPVAGTTHSLAIAAPDLPADSTAALAQAFAAKKSADTPNHRSIARWLNRTRLAKFLTAQTRWEEKSAADLGVGLSRATAPRVLIATVCAGPDGKLHQSLDLRQSDPVVAGAPEACASFRLMSGLTSTAFEGRVTGGRSVLDFWKSPDDFIVVSPKNRGRFAADLKTKGFPDSVVSRVKTGPEVLLFCKNPVDFGGEPLWGWLAIDPATYAVTSTLSTGENGALEEAIVEAIPNALSYAVGYLVGVESSIWSVSAFSLEGLPYAEVLAQAEKFAGGIAENFNGIGVDPKEVAKELWKRFNLFGSEYMEGGESYRKFSDGYAAGVAYYFKRARSGG